MIRLLAALIAAVLAVVAGPALAQFKPPPGFPHERHVEFKPDPAIKWGVLPNGMRYAIQRWPTPRNEVSLRLRVAAGSFMERDDQQGLAHFLEHMAFNGSENVPENEFDRILAREGLAFGPDTNAYTAFDETVYQLDMPNAARLPLGLSMMRETAGRLLLAPDAIDRERGIIVSEERARDNPSFRQFRAWAAASLEGTLVPKRLPIGSMEVVRTAPRERFVDFYRGFYTPERTLLVVVGDIDPAAAEAEIRRLFADWVQPATAAPDPAATPPRAEPGRATLLVEPQAPALVRLTVATPFVERPDTSAERRRELLRALGGAMIDDRLERIARRAGSPITVASASSGDWVRSAHVATIEARPSDPAKWREALDVIDVELRRALAHGFTDVEFATALADVEEGYRRAAQQANARRSAQIAQVIVATFADGSVDTDAASDLAWFQQVKPTLSAAGALTELKASWGETLPQVFVSVPAAVEGGVETVRAALAAARARPAPPPAVETARAWDYTRFGAPGRVVERRQVADLGVTQIRFANGVRLNVKPTTFEEGRVRVSVRFGAGQMGLPAAKPGLSFAIQSAFTAGGLGRLDADDLTRALAGRTVSTGLSVGEDAFQFGAATTPRDLELQMQVVAAFMTDPGWRPDGLARLKGAKDAIYRQIVDSPGAVWSVQGQRLLRSGDARFGFPTPEQFDALSLAAVRAALEPALKSAPIEVTIVGATDVDAAVRAVATTLGALPRRAATDGTTPAMRRVVFPEGRGTSTLTHAGRNDQALAMVFWPMRDYGDGAEARALRVLEAILQNRLNEEVRERLGDTYSPGTDWSPSTVFPGYGTIGAISEVKPADAERVVQVIERLAARLAQGDISDDLFQRARRPLIADIEETTANNPWWLNWLSGSQADPRRLTIIRDGKRQYEQVTLSQVRALARQYLDPTKARIVKVLPGPNARPAEAP